jgi:hypothetical protein
MGWGAVLLLRVVLDLNSARIQCEQEKQEEDEKQEKQEQEKQEVLLVIVIKYHSNLALLLTFLTMIIMAAAAQLQLHLSVNGMIREVNHSMIFVVFYYYS